MIIKLYQIKHGICVLSPHILHNNKTDVDVTALVHLYLNPSQYALFH
jgi:hypothetical protein